VVSFFNLLSSGGREKIRHKQRRTRPGRGQIEGAKSGLDPNNEPLPGATDRT